MRHSPPTFATDTGKHEEGLRKPMTHLWGKAIAAAVVVAGAKPVGGGTTILLHGTSS